MGTVVVDIDIELKMQISRIKILESKKNHIIVWICIFNSN